MDDEVEEYLIVNLPSGPVCDEVKRLLGKHPYVHSNNIEDLRDFVINSSLESEKNGASNKTGGVQSPASGYDINIQLKSYGPNSPIVGLTCKRRHKSTTERPRLIQGQNSVIDENETEKTGMEQGLPPHSTEAMVQWCRQFMRKIIAENKKNEAVPGAEEKKSMNEDKDFKQKLDKDRCPLAEKEAAEPAGDSEIKGKHADKAAN